MKILFLNDDYFPRGQSSPANIIRQLKKGMEDKGHEVYILTSHRKENNSEIIRDENVTSLPISYRISLKQWNCLYSPHVTKMVNAEIKRIKPDIIHAHNIHLYLTYDSLRIAKKYTPRVFITMHDVMSFAFWRLNTERYLNSNGSDTRLSILDHWRTAGLQYNPFRNFTIRRIIKKNVKGVIAVSNALKNALEDHGIKPVQTIHNGIDLSEWERNEKSVEEFRTRFSLHNRKVILFGGRLSTDKGSTQLLQALFQIRKEVPNVLLLVLGSEKRWSDCVRTANITEDISDNVLCTGWIDRKDIQSAFFASDVVTTPSLCLDCFPQTNLEAMAAGKPVVGTCFGGTKEIVQDGITGIILDPRDQDQFTQNVCALLHNSKKAITMGEEGHHRIEERFSIQAQVEKYMQLTN